MKKKCKGCFKEFEKSDLIKGVCKKCIIPNEMVLMFSSSMGVFLFPSDSERSIFYAKTKDAEYLYSDYTFTLIIKKTGE